LIFNNLPLFDECILKSLLIKHGIIRVPIFIKIGNPFKIIIELPYNLTDLTFDFGLFLQINSKARQAFYSKHFTQLFLDEARKYKVHDAYLLASNHQLPCHVIMFRIIN